MNGDHKNKDKKRSMLVHPSTSRTVHAEYKGWIDGIIRDYAKAYKTKAYNTKDKSQRIDFTFSEIEKDFLSSYDEIKKTKNDFPNYDDKLILNIHKALDEIKNNIDLFNASRSKDYNFNKALSSCVNDVDLYFYHKKSPINTIDKKTSEFQKAKVTSIKKIKTDTLDNIILNTKYKDSSFDLLSIDVEGHELEVLKGFNLVKFSPNVIVVEYLDLNVSNLEIKNLSIEYILDTELYKYLISKNYILVNSIYSDLVFVNKKFRD
jgi:FkbM family methyltransferase